MPAERPQRRIEPSRRSATETSEPSATSTTALRRPTGTGRVAPEAGPALPRLARLEFLPRGGRLTVGYAGWERTLWLADRRCDLVATLLFPPAPYAAGDLIPDEALIPRVWPGGRQGGRVELNTLVFRTRKDLVRADVDGAALLDRYDGGVRFRLADGADVAMVPPG